MREDPGRGPRPRPRPGPGPGPGRGSGSGYGYGEPDWRSGANLNGVDRPEVVLAAFARNEPMVGVAVIALALNHPEPSVVLPVVAGALESPDREIRRQGVVALAHVARLHRTVDRRCLELLRGCPRGNEADDDLWSFVPHRRLPLWLWRHHLSERLLGWRG